MRNGCCRSSPGRSPKRSTSGRLAEALPDSRTGFERSAEISDALTIGAAVLASVSALLQGGMGDAAAVVLGVLDAEVIWTFSASGYGIFERGALAIPVEAALGANAYAAAHARGQALTYDEAVAFVRGALGDLAAVVTEDPARG